MTCPICGQAPALASGRQSYFLWAPPGHSENKLRRALETAGAEPERRAESGAIAFAADAGAALKHLNAGAQALTAAERRDTLILECPEEEGGNAGASPKPYPRDLRAVRSLEQFLALRGARWLIGAVEEGRLEVGLARIAFADDLGETFGYEAAYHGRDAQGALVPFRDLLQTAKRAGMLAPVDRTGRISAIGRASRVALDYPVFIPFSPATIYDPEFCLQTSVQAAEDHGMPADSLIFTIFAPEPEDDPGHLERILEFYRRHGFRVALAGVGSGLTAFDLLPRLRPDFLFLDASLTASAPSDPLYGVIARKLLEIAHRVNVETVVEGIEDTAQADWAYENGANYVSGPLVADALAPASAAE